MHDHIYCTTCVVHLYTCLQFCNTLGLYIDIELKETKINITTSEFVKVPN